MRDFVILAFILALPAFAVLGHDIYMAYNNTALDVGERFYLSDLGWLWVKYEPNSYNFVIESTDPEIWNNFIDPILRESALYVALVPLAILLGVVFVLKLFGLGVFEGQGIFAPRIKQKKGGDFSFSGRGGKKQAKYKRK